MSVSEVGTADSCSIEPLITENEANVESLPKSVVKAHACTIHNKVLCIEDNPTNQRLVQRIHGTRQDIELLTAWSVNAMMADI